MENKTQKAIIHTSTRVIRRLTTDDESALIPVVTFLDPSTGDESTTGVLLHDESYVVLDTPIDIAGGDWKLDEANQKVLASPSEVALAEVGYGV